MMENLFVYGTLLDKDVEKKVIGRIAKSTNDILEGYKKSSIVIENKEYPAIIKSKSGTISGKIISVSKSELNKIDKYETDKYKREKVILRSGKTAWVYIKH